MSSLALLVVDDEPLARNRLIRLLKDLGYGQIDEASSAADARNQIKSQAMDIVFLDVRMPEEDGLSLAKSLQALDSPPSVIFTTAYDEYALPAFDVFAAGFLLKPIDKHRLERVLERIANKLETQRQPERNLRLRCQMKGATVYLPIESIRLFQAEDKYVVIHSTEGVGLTDKSLKQLDDEFADSLLRIHRNALVNKDFLSGLKKVANETHLLLSECDVTPTVSRRFLPSVKKALTSLA